MTDGIWLVVASAGGPGRLAMAGGVVVGYLAFCAFVLLSHRRRPAAIATSAVSSTGDDATIVAFASQTGYAETLATETAERLRAGRQPVVLVPFDRLTLPMLERTRRALFVVSTTGSGDPPDSASRFWREALASATALDEMRFGVLALGDRGYDEYCAFGYALDRWLRTRMAAPLFGLIAVDAGDVAAVDHWRTQVAALGGARELAAVAGTGFSPWRLVERRVLNAGSPGGPAYHVALAPEDVSALAWDAGDIAEIVPGPRDSYEDAPVVTRHYSIASLPGDGRIELLVRQVRREDRTFGLGSGWLTAHAPIGDPVWLRIRRNAAFHPPEADCPLILIGNGTGLAGLRAHIKARANAGRHRNWLLFGERTPCHDRLHGEEIDGWVRRGVLERCDLAFSREEAAPAYVQDLLLREADALGQWLHDGAAIYVCGSRAGMSVGVDHALSQILGAAELARLREQGFYRRDVY